MNAGLAGCLDGSRAHPLVVVVSDLLALPGIARGLDALQALRADIIVSKDIEEGKLHEPTDFELRSLLSEPFQRGRILDQRRYEGKSRDIYYLVYREPDGRVYALMAAEYKGRFRIVIPEVPMSRRHRYLWDYTWTN